MLTVRQQKLWVLRTMVQTTGKGSIEQHKEGSDGIQGLVCRDGFAFEEVGG